MEHDGRLSEDFASDVIQGPSANLTHPWSRRAYLSLYTAVVLVWSIGPFRRACVALGRNAMAAFIPLMIRSGLLVPTHDVVVAHTEEMDHEALCILMILARMGDAGALDAGAAPHGSAARLRWQLVNVNSLLRKRLSAFVLRDGRQMARAVGGWVLVLRASEVDLLRKLMTSIAAKRRTRGRRGAFLVLFADDGGGSASAIGRLLAEPRASCSVPWAVLRVLLLGTRSASSVLSHLPDEVLPTLFTFLRRGFWGSERVVLCACGNGTCRALAGWWAHWGDVLILEATPATRCSCSTSHVPGLEQHSWLRYGGLSHGMQWLAGRLRCQHPAADCCWR